MYRRLFALNGLAIIAVVINHAGAYGQFAMFLWVHRYRPVTSPNWDLLQSFPYYITLITRQLAIFSVPAFIFVSGFFIAYTSSGTRSMLNWKIVKSRIVSIFIPYLFWSIIVFITDYIFGEIHSPSEYLEILLTKGAIGPYWFVPTLCYLYVFSPYILWLTRSNWRITLISSTILLGGIICINYFNIFPSNYLISAWSPLLWSFYFVIGIFVGLNLQPFTKWLDQYKRVFWGILPITIILLVYEADTYLRTTLDGWGVSSYMVTFHLYSILFILCFMTLKSIPFSKSISQLSGKTYGIYLIHMIVMLVYSKLIYNFIPNFLAYPLLFELTLIGVGFGVPLLMMAISKSWLRSYYRYIFA